MKPSTYLLNSDQRRKYRDVSEVHISIWGQVPAALDELIGTGLWGDTRAAVYYRLAMDKLIELETAKRNRI